MIVSKVSDQLSASPLALNEAIGAIGGGTVVPRCRRKGTDAWRGMKPVAVIVARRRGGPDTVAACDVGGIRIVTRHAGFLIDHLSHCRSGQHRGGNQAER